MVRIRFPPAESPQTIGSSAANFFDADFIHTERPSVDPELTIRMLCWSAIAMASSRALLRSTEDDLLRQVVYEGLREDKPAAEVRRSVPRHK